MNDKLLRSAFYEVFRAFTTRYPKRWGSQQFEDNLRKAENAQIINEWMARFRKIEATAEMVTQAGNKSAEMIKFSTYPPSLEEFVQLIELQRFEQSNPGYTELLGSVKSLNIELSSRYGHKWQKRDDILTFCKSWATTLSNEGLNSSDLKVGLSKLSAFPKFVSDPPSRDELVMVCKWAKCDNPPPHHTLAVNQAFSMNSEVHPLVEVTKADIGYNTLNSMNADRARMLFSTQYKTNFEDYINGDLVIEVTNDVVEHDESSSLPTEDNLPVSEVVSQLDQLMNKFSKK